MRDEALELLWADMFPNCSESDIADLLGWQKGGIPGQSWRIDPESRKHMYGFKSRILHFTGCVLEAKSTL